MTSWISGSGPIVISCLFMLETIIVTFVHCCCHLRNYNKPYLQNHVMRILVVAPIYGIGTFISLTYPSGDFAVSTIRDIWEAIVVYAFLMLIMEYMGGEHGCMTQISRKEEGVAPQIWPLNYCCGPVPQGEMIRLPKRLTLQFVFLKPLMAVLNILFFSYNPGKLTKFLIMITYNVSYTLALAGLFLIYFAAHDLPSLESRKIGSKFISVKSVIFLTYWQSFFFPLLISGTELELARWENFVLSAESAIFTLALTFSFYFQEFVVETEINMDPTKVAPSPCGNQTNLEMFDLEMKGDDDTPTSPPTVFSPRSPRENDAMQWLKNAKSAFNPTDVLVDAHQSFSKRYARHVILEDEREEEHEHHHTILSEPETEEEPETETGTDHHENEMDKTSIVSAGHQSINNQNKGDIDLVTSGVVNV